MFSIYCDRYNYTCCLLVYGTELNQSEQVITVAVFNNNGTFYLFIGRNVSVITFYPKVSVISYEVNELKMTMQCKFKLQGLTLIELLLTLAILTILMACGAPSYSAYVHKNKLCNLTRQLVEALNITKQLALLRGEQHYFNIQVNNAVNSTFDSCWVISNNENCDCLISTALCQSNYGQASAAISDIALSVNRPNLSFSPLFGTTNGASYQLSLGRFSTMVIVSTQGRIRVCMVQGDSAIYAPC